MPIYLKEMGNAAIDALQNDRYLYGENVIKFEEEFARYIGTDYAISTASGTAALSFILTALQSEHQKWITSPMSFIASSNCVVHAGGTPLFADISMKDYCIDPVLAEKQVKTGANGIIPVHIYGQSIDYSAFDYISEKYGTNIVEDACQAHGAEYRGRKVGSLGVAAAFSFYPSKNMTVLGDGGMVTTNDDTVAKTVSKLRDSGRISKYEHDMIGYTSRMSSLSAAIGRVQLKHLDGWNAKRRVIASKYAKKLGDLMQIKLPPQPTKESKPVYHQFVILTERRDELKEYLDKKGIETGIHYPIPIHLQPIYKKLYGYKPGAYPKSEKFAKQCLSLPMHVMLSDENVSYICESITEFFDG